MTDDQTGVEEVAEAPAEEVPASESTKEVVDQQQPEEQESPESDTGKNESEPPKENAAWAAMRAENKRLKEVVESVDPEYLNKLQGASYTPQVNPQVNPINPDADYTEAVDRLNWTQQQAVNANQQIAQLRNQLELQQDRMAEEAFPKLKTDKSFQQLVAEKKLAARILGRDITTVEIAREVDRLLSRRDEQTAAVASEEVKKQVVEKQAAMAEVKGTSSGGRSTTDDESLRVRVRKGDSNAQTEVAKRLVADLEF